MATTGLNYKVVLTKILDALNTDGLLPHIDLATCSTLNTLDKIHKNRHIQTLLTIFSGAGLQPIVGYNAGKEEMSVMLAFPEAIVEEGPSLVVQCMLGLLPCQSKLEECYGSQQDSVVEGKGRGVLLANRCLQVFTDQTGVGITDKTPTLRLQRVRVVVQPCKCGVVRVRDGVQFSDQKTPLYRYSPAYHRITGYDVTAGTYSDETLARQEQDLIHSMLNMFWDLVDAQQYIADDNLMDQVAEPLRAFLASGMRGQSSRFRPKGSPMVFYVHGLPGAGKSSFVKVFRMALQSLLQLNFDPLMLVNVVKVPLNAITAENLRAILHVQGISDCSVERILEQTIAKGHVVMFHLEENPEDPQQQMTLFEMTRKLVKTLVTRYPEYASNLLYLVTSNYAPAPAIAKEARVVLMRPPHYAKQQDWCRRMLTETIKAHAEVDVSVLLHTPPHQSEDMRNMEKWRMSVGYHISKHITKHSHPARQLASYQVAIQNKEADGSTMDVSVDGLPPLVLDTTDHYFYCHPTLTSGLTSEQWQGIPTCNHAVVATLLEMYADNYLRPLVVVLTGAKGHRATARACLEALVRERVNDLHECMVSVLREQDKECVLGKTHELMGGLFRFIDEVNNPARLATAETIAQKEKDAHTKYRTSDAYALIIAHVNEVGQFVLRELLESGSSDTHWQRVCKDRVMFLLDIPEGSGVSSTVQSRAHHVIHCG